MRALIVDDDGFDRDTCRRALEALSWQVDEAEGPEEAVERLAQRLPDLIVSDYDLKALNNGVDLLAQVAKEYPGVRRVLMSGLVPRHVLDAAKEKRHVEAFFEKPDRLAEWEDTLRRVIGRLGLNGADADRARVAKEAWSVVSASRDGDPRTREKNLEQRVRWLSGVVDLGLAAHSGAPLQETFDRAVRLVSDSLGMEYTKILQLLPGGREVLLVAGVGWKPGLVGKARVSTGLDSQAGYTLVSKHPVIAEDLRAETRFSGPQLLHEHGVVSGLSVVIPGEEGRPWGVFGAHTKEHLHLTKDHALFLSAVANVVAGAVARARTEDALRGTKEVLQREVADRTRELQAAVDDLQAFNAMVAHDLRSPLRHITHAADTILREHSDSLTPDARHLLEIVNRNAGQMRDLLEDLLALAKATQDPLNMESVDVSELFLDRWEHQRHREPRRGVRIVVADGLSAHADPRLLAIVVDNLLSNAIKFSRNAEHPLVEVGLTHLPVGGSAFYVRDNGAGFPPELAPHLFHPFKRLHSVKEYEGTGIGLTTVRRIVERHGGSVWAESKGPGEGATFYFRLLPAGLP